MHPILFQIGPVTLYSYGLMLAIGFMAAMALVNRRARLLHLQPAAVQGIGCAALVGGVIGGRAAYVALNWELYRQDWVEIFRLDHGGLVFYGGLLGGVALSYWAIRRKQLSFLRTVDLFIPPFVLAHAIGRVGCFANGCCYGKWGHPTQLYETGALLLIFLYLRFLEKREPPGAQAGRVAFSYGLLYGSWRFGIEFLRGDNLPIAWGLTAFQLASVPLALLCGWFLLKRAT